MSDLPGEVAKVVGSLGTAHLHALAAAYRGAGSFSAASAARARDVVPAPHRGTVDRLNAAWQAEPDLDGGAVALAIEATQAARDAVEAPDVEVVVTGPDSPAVPVRLTSEVVRQLIDRSTQRVTLVSYAAYRMASVIAALDAAVARGVAVTLILESAENLEGGGGAQPYGRYQLFHWPADRREPPDAKLHAKAVIVDSREMLLTSANMTHAAYDKNIELGVLCRGGGVARQVQRHFDALIGRGVLRPVQ